MYRGASFIRKRPPVGPDGRLMPRALKRSQEVGVSYARGTPVAKYRPVSREREPTAHTSHTPFEYLSFG